MPYASLQDLTDRFGERLLIDLTDRGEEATNTIDTDVVDRALADADAQIDGYLMSAGYVLPLSEIPPLVQGLAIALAIWKLNVLEPGPKIEADYKAAVRSLESIAEGTMRLPVNGTEPADDGNGAAMVTDRERPMTAENLKGFI